MEDGLYNFDTSCPKCGGKTDKKQVGLAIFVMCQDIMDCDYYEIEKINSIIDNPSEERVKWERSWYKERFDIFVLREKSRIKKEFIAKEMERLKMNI